MKLSAKPRVFLVDDSLLQKTSSSAVAATAAIATKAHLSLRM